MRNGDSAKFEIYEQYNIKIYCFFPQVHTNCNIFLFLSSQPLADWLP